MIYNSIGELIGGTPIIRLRAIEEKYSLSARLYAKLEYLNPTGSVKDRAAKYMIEDAIKNGKITSDTVIIEPTSGNTGIGLAAICSSLSLRSVIVMPENMSKERQSLIKAYGAEVVLTDKDRGMAGAIEVAEKLLKEYPHAFIPSQFDNPQNTRAHIETTGPEIYSDLEGNVDYFVAGIGTGGTLSGIAEYLKSQKKDVRIIGVEPHDSPLITKGRVGAHKIQGIGANFIPSLYNSAVVDEVMAIKSSDAYDAVRTLGQSMGIAVGISSGAALFAAIDVASRNEAEGKSVVVLFPDGIDRYLTTDLFD